MLMHGWYIPTQMSNASRVTPRYRQTIGMRQRVCQRQGLEEAAQRLMWVSQQPESFSGIHSTVHAGIGPHTKYWSTVLVWRIAGDAGLQVLAGSRQYAKVEPRQPEGLVGDDSKH